jgi:hypothetical protein
MVIFDPEDDDDVSPVRPLDLKDQAELVVESHGILMFALALLEMNRFRPHGAFSTGVVTLTGTREFTAFDPLPGFKTAPCGAAAMIPGRLTPRCRFL